jgi:CheY-like chemotaxis protein
MYSVLIVDDNAINQKVLKQHLTTSGFKCTVASNGLEALNLMDKHKYNVVFMDIEVCIVPYEVSSLNLLQMPIMDGLEACKKIRDRERRQHKLAVPIIGLSGNARQEQIEQAISVGMDAYILCDGCLTCFVC